jgi:hypothetical protein
MKSTDRSYIACISSMIKIYTLLLIVDMNKVSSYILIKSELIS